MRFSTLLCTALTATVLAAPGAAPAQVQAGAKDPAAIARAILDPKRPDAEREAAVKAHLDLAPEIILSSVNVVDDVDHCLRANTSPHLAEQQAGHRDFVYATLPDVLTGNAVLPDDGPIVFSPFGLGVLDLALARHVYDQVDAGGELRTVPGFFNELNRYGGRS